MSNQRLFLGSLTTTGGVEANKCSADAMSRCTDPLKVVTDNKDLGFATSKDELDEMCPWVTCWQYQYWHKCRLRPFKIIVSIKNREQSKFLCYKNFTLSLHYTTMLLCERSTSHMVLYARLLLVAQLMQMFLLCQVSVGHTIFPPASSDWCYLVVG